MLAAAFFLLPVMHLLDGLHCPANSKALTGQLMKTTITLRLPVQGPLLGEAGGEQRVCEF